MDIEFDELGLRINASGLQVLAILMWPAEVLCSM
jgi:hypothetical protein